MAFDYKISGVSGKQEKYRHVLEQLEAIIAHESNLIANMANICAVLKTEFGWFWIGFYLTDTPEELVLGPFQGSLACTRISKGKGVCGTAWQQAATIVVPDVDQFPGHIACSALSRSEIVVPLMVNGEVAAVLDADSELYDTFDDTDAHFLEKLLEKLADRIK
ncbi:MAG: diguanylate cyclase [Bacteroidetes bacterium 47-18]|nr:MAG: diguanylate cyclase [Bacteroidetes bacterium 47-18]